MLYFQLKSYRSGTVLLLKSWHFPIIGRLFRQDIRSHWSKHLVKAFVLFNAETIKATKRFFYKYLDCSRLNNVIIDLYCASWSRSERICIFLVLPTINTFVITVTRMGDKFSLGATFESYYTTFWPNMCNF